MCRASDALAQQHNEIQDLLRQLLRIVAQLSKQKRVSESVLGCCQTLVEGFLDLRGPEDLQNSSFKREKEIPNLGAVEHDLCRARKRPVRATHGRVGTLENTPSLRTVPPNRLVLCVNMLHVHIHPSYSYCFTSSFLNGSTFKYEGLETLAAAPRRSPRPGHCLCLKMSLCVGGPDGWPCTCRLADLPSTSPRPKALRETRI